MSFQSRFGPQEWLKPYMNEKFKELIEKDLTDINVIAPGFSVDCLETLEENKDGGKRRVFRIGRKEIRIYSVFKRFSRINQTLSKIN